MLWDIIKALVAALVPILYAIIIAKYPNFPLSLEQTIALILWVLGLFFAGWHARGANNHATRRK